MTAASARVSADGNAQLRSENSALHPGLDEGIKDEIHLGPQQRTHKNLKTDAYVRRPPWVQRFNSSLVNLAKQKTSAKK